MPKKIAIVEDEAELASLIEYNLTHHGYEAHVLPGGAGTLRSLEQAKPDLILLDVMLPDTDGFEVCRQIRQSPVLARIPVLFLTARSDEVDRVLGLEIGGDDYMTKPFSPRELIARVRALLRRTRPDRETPVLEMGDLRIDLLAREITRQGESLTLTPREYDLLVFFVQNPGRVLTRDELLRKVWGYDYLGETRTVDVHIRRLRMKLGDTARRIETVTGIGYKFAARETVEP
jgi:two-component system alkaline phosphatase synthesis response regulator PhoP